MNLISFIAFVLIAFLVCRGSFKKQMGGGKAKYIVIGGVVLVGVSVALYFGLKSDPTCEKFDCKGAGTLKKNPKKIKCKGNPCKSTECCDPTKGKGGASGGKLKSDPTQQVVKCQSGFHLDNNKCIPNICTCLSGTPAIAPACAKHHTEQCSKCDDGYHLDPAGVCQAACGGCESDSDCHSTGNASLSCFQNTKGHYPGCYPKPTNKSFCYDTAAGKNLNLPHLPHKYKKVTKPELCPNFGTFLNYGKLDHRNSDTPKAIKPKSGAYYWPFTGNTVGCKKLCDDTPQNSCNAFYHDTRESQKACYLYNLPLSDYKKYKKATFAVANHPRTCYLKHQS